MISGELLERIESQIGKNRKVTFLVGAGLSAESGIPTFRGKDGFWVSGSKNYQPEEIGTKRMFDENSREVWSWYLYRISMCKKARPNIGHQSLVEIEKELADRFALISQNVDGLHFEAGNSEKRLYLIHGDLRYMRCSKDCSTELYIIPEEITSKSRSRESFITQEESALLKCPKCGEESRPHVLWFDEYYDQKYYQLHDVLRIAKLSGLLFVIGTSGATNLPRMIVENTLRRQGIVIEINPNESYFSEKLTNKKNGYWIKEKSGKVLSELNRIIKER